MDGWMDGWMDGMGWDGMGWDGMGWDGWMDSSQHHLSDRAGEFLRYGELVNSQLVNLLTFLLQSLIEMLTLFPSDCSLFCSGLTSNRSSDHVVVSVSFNFPCSLKGDAPFHHIALSLFALIRINFMITALEFPNSSSLTCIPMVILKSEVSYKLSDLLNTCFMEYSFQGCWRILSNNQYSINPISVFIRIFELIIIGFLITLCHLFCDFQYGFSSSNSNAAFSIVAADGTSRPNNAPGVAQDLFIMIYHRFLIGFGMMVL